MLERTKGKLSVKSDIKRNTPRGIPFLIAIKRGGSNLDTGE